MFASKYALESSRRDLHDALLCTVHRTVNGSTPLHRLHSFALRCGGCAQDGGAPVLDVELPDAREAVPRLGVGIIGNIRSKILKNFGGLVLGRIEADFFK